MPEHLYTILEAGDMTGFSYASDWMNRQIYAVAVTDEPPQHGYVTISFEGEVARRFEPRFYTWRERIARGKKLANIKRWRRFASMLRNAERRAI